MRPETLIHVVSAKISFFPSQRKVVLVGVVVVEVVVL